MTKRECRERIRDAAREWPELSLTRAKPNAGQNGYALNVDLTVTLRNMGEPATQENCERLLALFGKAGTVSELFTTYHRE